MPPGHESERSAEAGGDDAGLFDRAPLALATVGFDGSVRALNDAWAALVRRPADELRTQRWLDGAHADDRAKLERAVEALRGGGGTVTVEARFRAGGAALVSLACELWAAPGARAFHCAARAAPGASAPGAFGPTEAALLRTLTDNAPFGLYMVARDTDRVTFANRKACELWRMEHLADRLARGEVTHGEVLEHCARLVKPGALTPEQCAELWKRGGESVVEFETPLLDGRTVRWLAAPVRDERGRKLGMLYIDEDITDRKSAEHGLRDAAFALERSEAQFRRMIEYAPEAIWAMRDGRFAYANAAATRLFGYTSADEMLGLSYMTILTPGEVEPVAQRIASVLSTGQTTVPREALLRRRDDTTVTVEAMAMRVELSGTPCVLVMARDVTERKLIQARLLQADRLAAVGTLAAGVAHEVNNPLAYVLLNLEQIQRQLGELATGLGVPAATAAALGELVGLVAQSREGAERMREIVRDLKTFSRPDDERRAFVDVRAVLDSTLQMAASEVRRRARLVRAYQDVPSVSANESRLGQVFLNLVVNAVQAIPEDHAEENEIRVTVRPEGTDRVVVEVSDTGEGIPAAALPRIFDPFFTTKPVGVGTGLGLSVCMGIVRGLGGELTATSEVGRGSTFRVSLPTTQRTGGQG